MRQFLGIMLISGVLIVTRLSLQRLILQSSSAKITNLLFRCFALNLHFFLEIFFSVSNIENRHPDIYRPNLGNLLEEVNVPRCARPAKSGCKYLFHRKTRDGRGRGYLPKTKHRNAKQVTVKKCPDKKCPVIHRNIQPTHQRYPRVLPRYHRHRRATCLQAP